jgi:hypothetical protein
LTPPISNQLCYPPPPNPKPPGPPESDMEGHPVMMWESEVQRIFHELVNNMVHLRIYKTRDVEAYLRELRLQAQTHTLVGGGKSEDTMSSPAHQPEDHTVTEEDEFRCKTNNTKNSQLEHEHFQLAVEQLARTLHDATDSIAAKIREREADELRAKLETSVAAQKTAGILVGHGGPHAGASDMQAAMKMDEAIQNEENVISALVFHDMLADQQLQHARQCHEDAFALQAVNQMEFVASDRKADRKLQEAAALQVDIDACTRHIAETHASDLARSMHLRSLEQEADAQTAALHGGVFGNAPPGAAEARELKELDEEMRLHQHGVIVDAMVIGMNKRQMMLEGGVQEEGRKEEVRAIISANVVEAMQASEEKSGIERLLKEGQDAAATAIVSQLARLSLESALEKAERDPQGRKRPKEEIRRLKENIAARKIQQRWTRRREDRLKMERARLIRLKKQKYAAMELLRAFRRRKANLAHKREVHLRGVRQKEAAAVLYVQSHWRRRRTSVQQAQVLQAKRSHLKRTLVAKALQRHFRRRKAQRRLREVRYLRHHLKEEAYVTRIQNAWKRRRGRKQLGFLRGEKRRREMEGYAIRVQAVWRRYLGNKKVRELKAAGDRQMEKAMAIKLQAAWRRRQGRKTIRSLRFIQSRKKQEAAAVMLQSAWRRRHAIKQATFLKGCKRMKAKHLTLQQLEMELEALRRKTASKQAENDFLWMQVLELRRDIKKRRCCGCACSVQ